MLGMDPHNSFFKKLPLLMIGGGFVLLVGLFVWPQFMPKTHKASRVVANTIGDQWSFSQVMQMYGQAWVSVQEKVNALKHADEDNAKLRLENAHLKLGLEGLQFSCNARSGETSTHELSLKLNKETGDRAGRSLASINYKPPGKLVPSQLYTLGISYLKAREDEKAAVIFTSLTGLEESKVYKTAKNLLITGVAWYRLENYALADSYFDEVLKTEEKPDSIQFQAQARLWKALVAKKLNKEIKAQYWLKDLMDHHPYSAEVGWVNLGEVEHAKDHH
jgi:hypothetical protein